MSKTEKRHIAILGSTGSIGTQALEVIKEHSDVFELEVITANTNAELLISQAIEFMPNAVVIADESKLEQTKAALEPFRIKVYGGEVALREVVTIESIHMVLTALVGFSGLLPTISAIQAKKHIALANKETLVVAGDLITSLAEENQVLLLPVDSEHSAIFQCLVGENVNPIERIILTCSGGPFRGKTRAELEHVGPKQALKHPNWDMGQKISIDSATLMNKGLEAIEAKWLFGLEPNQIEVIVHPESIIHSLVEFEDSSIKAQLGLPDMRVPIQYALSFPMRLKNSLTRFDFKEYPKLHFEQPDKTTFRNLDLAFQAMNKGGNSACVLNAANEEVVFAFLRNQVGFLQMSDIIEKALNEITFIENPSLENYIQTDKETRKFVHKLIV